MTWALVWWALNTQTPEAWCVDTCLVLDMDVVGVYGCDCVCKDVDGTVHRETVPDCP